LLEGFMRHLTEKHFLLVHQPVSFLDC
jgi:hypothetical protein